MTFATYEEAVKTIDSMGLKDREGNYESYSISLLKDVEIGNEDGNRKYVSLPFPSKASEFLLWGNKRSITFAGNLSPRCDTIFALTRLTPVKTGKNEVVSTKPDLTVGNHSVTLMLSAIYEYGSQDNYGSFGRITGSAKGSFSVAFMTPILTNADSISGLGTLTLSQAFIAVQGDVTVKELRCAEGGLKLGGTLTADAIYQQEDFDVIIQHNADKPIVVKGITRTGKDDNGKPITIKDSVMVTDSDGSVYDNAKGSIIVFTLTEDGSALPVGTKVVTGNYLDPEDWHFTDGKYDKWFIHYKSGNALFIGEEITD